MHFKEWHRTTTATLALNTIDHMPCHAIFFTLGILQPNMSECVKTHIRKIKLLGYQHMKFVAQSTIND